MKKLSLFALIGLFVSLACLSSSPSTSTPQSSPTVDIQSTQTKEYENQQATASAQAAAESARVTATANAQAALEITSQAATQEVLSAATAAASDMALQVKKLYSDRVISSAGGEYFLLPDFDESWAQINWYQWYETDYEPDNFVIRTDISWDSASTTANWFASGCGMVFREVDEDNHYFVFVALDGNVYLNGYKNGKFISLGKKWFGKPDLPSGNADFMMAVDRDWITIYVNGRQVLRKQDASFSNGKLALTLASGTNKDYGTRCQMTNLELWQIY